MTNMSPHLRRRGRRAAALLVSVALLSSFGDVTQIGPNVFEGWLASAGEIRITASSGSRLSGTFELSAESPFVDGPGPITVTGTFDAIFMDARGFPGLAP